LKNAQGKHPGILDSRNIKLHNKKNNMKKLLVLFWIITVSNSVYSQITFVTHGQTVAIKDNNTGKWKKPVTDYNKTLTWVFSKVLSDVMVFDKQTAVLHYKLTNLKKIVNSEFNEWRWNCYDYQDKTWMQLIYDLNKETLNINGGYFWIEYHVDDNFTQENNL